MDIDFDLVVGGGIWSALMLINFKLMSIRDELRKRRN